LGIKKIQSFQTSIVKKGHGQILTNGGEGKTDHRRKASKWNNKAEVTGRDGQLPVLCLGLRVEGRFYESKFLK